MNFIKVIINIQMTRIKLQIKIYQDPIYIPPRLILNVDANIIKKHRKTKYCLVECNFASILKHFTTKSIQKPILQRIGLT